MFRYISIFLIYYIKETEVAVHCLFCWFGWYYSWTIATVLNCCIQRCLVIEDNYSSRIHKSKVLLESMHKDVKDSSVKKNMFKSEVCPLVAENSVCQPKQITTLFSL